MANNDPRYVTMPATATDLELLGRFEPVCVFTKGEQFYPMDVESYVRDCSLWAHYPDGKDELLVRQGDLNLNELIKTRPAVFGTVQYLRFIEPLTLTEAAQALAEQTQLRHRLGNHFRAGMGRLARGGFLPRLVDALFSLSFLLRGKVSAATAAAAEIDYQRIHTAEPKYTYYGRVVRHNGWIVLQYWFFYCYNSWRSGFNGVNDHESDWEMVNIYLYEENDLLRPEWVGYASHDFKGDDLRRRWDDAAELDVTPEGHPIVYVGAGSHASYFRPGEYMAEVTLPLPPWMEGINKAWNKFWTETLGQAASNPFRIPFVDFARGDGLKIGFGQPQTWSPVQVSESTPWVGQYRGLWGLFARDPISGENAPAGPMYNRDGSPRGAWYDPLGFAGLDKVPTPPQAITMLEDDCAEISSRQHELDRVIPVEAGELQSLGIKLKGMEDNPHLAKQYAALEKLMIEKGQQVRALRREYSENAALLQGLTYRLECLKTGQRGDPQAHIRHLAAPVEHTGERFSEFAEVWAALSLSGLLFLIALLTAFTWFLAQSGRHFGSSDLRFVLTGTLVIMLLFVIVESILRRAFVHTIARTTLILAMVSAVVLFFKYWALILAASLVAIAIYLLAVRWRELAGG